MTSRAVDQRRTTEASNRPTANETPNQPARPIGTHHHVFISISQRHITAGRLPSAHGPLPPPAARPLMRAVQRARHARSPTQQSLALLRVRALAPLRIRDEVQVNSVGVDC